MKTDFQIAAYSAAVALLSGVGAIIVDIAWAFSDFFHAPAPHHMPVAIGLGITIIPAIVSLVLLVKALKRHNETGRKPVQGPDDIDLRVKLALMKYQLEEKHSCAHPIKNRVNKLRHIERKCHAPVQTNR